jgi:ferredoxin
MTDQPPIEYERAAMKKINVDKPACIGAGMCTAAAPGVFDLGSDGLVTLIQATDEVADDAVSDVEHAIAVCPAQVLQWA